MHVRFGVQSRLRLILAIDSQYLKTLVEKMTKYQRYSRIMNISISTILDHFKKTDIVKKINKNSHKLIVSKRFPSFEAGAKLICEFQMTYDEIWNVYDNSKQLEMLYC